MSGLKGTGIMIQMQLHHRVAPEQHRSGLRDDDRWRIQMIWPSHHPFLKPFKAQDFVGRNCRTRWDGVWQKPPEDTVELLYSKFGPSSSISWTWSKEGGPPMPGASGGGVRLDSAGANGGGLGLAFHWWPGSLKAAPISS